MDDVADEDPDVDDVAVEVTPVVAVDAARPPSPPADDELSPDADVAEAEPPLPAEIGEEQAASASAGTARVMRRVKEDEVFIPGA